MSEVSIPNVLNISDLPPEILVKIILHLNARERNSLANCYEVLRNVVFGEKKLLRELDFSEEGRLTSASDIHAYFGNDNISKHILKVNVRNVNCLQPERMLNYIGNAVNLVDVNIHGTVVDNTQQLMSLLKPLTHVKRLSIDWPETVWTTNVPVFKEPFSTLTYLSVKVNCANSFANFVTFLELCQELKELRIIEEDPSDHAYSAIGDTVNNNELKKLEILEFCGNDTESFENYFVNMLPDIEEWTNLLGSKGFYFVKNLEICEALVESQSNEHHRPVDDGPINMRMGHHDLGDAFALGANMDLEIVEDLLDMWGNIPPEDDFRPYMWIDWYSLLEEVIRTTGAIPPRNLCCLSTGQCLLKIDELKELLKNPRHPITCLFISHNIDTECDVHLLGSAFPNLTELHLSNITRSRVSSSRDPYFSVYPGPSWSNYNPGRGMHMRNAFSFDSSFKMLVEKTPGVTDLTLDARMEMLKTDEAWDLSALDIILGWKHLKSLRLSSIPIVQGNYLRKIGEQCTQLEKLELYDLGPSAACCYERELLLMLPQCKNLMDFSLKADNVRWVPELLGSLANNLELVKVRLVLTISIEIHATADLLSSVEQLLRACSKLTTFVCIIDGLSRAQSDQLSSLLRRLRDELNRPTFQFQVVRRSESVVSPEMHIVREDTSLPSFPYYLKEFSYQ